MNSTGGFRMQSYLLEKMSCVTDEEMRILNGESIYRELYSKDENFIIQAENIGKRDICISRHIRYAPFPTHSHNYIEMMIVLKGSITHRIDGRALKLCRGDILFLNKHISHSIDLASDGDIGVNIIISDGFIGSVIPMLSETVFSTFIKENSRADGAPMYLCFSTDGKQQIENLTENMLFELTGERADGDILTKTLALLLCYLSLESDSLLISTNVPETEDGKRKKAIIAYLNDNYKTATLTELSRLLYLSEPYMSKLTYRLFGKNFKELLIDERMRRAINLLCESDQPISEIIQGVGYENASYFHREFKKRYAKTPLAIRNSGVKKQK